MTELLRVDNLRLAFTTHGYAQEVLRGVSFRVRRGSVVALVGESGSGKSVTAQATMGLLPKSATISGGSITFHDPATERTTLVSALERDGIEMRSLRGARMAMIFQEPMTALSPLHTIGDQVSEMLSIHDRADRKTMRARTEDMLARVGFPDPKRAFDMYAFELSGGLRQRAMIAMALMCNPALLIADEPTTALDVTIQAQVLSLLKSLRAERDMGLLLITHDLGVVANMADEVVVMYHGQVMEAGPVEAIFRNPQHPYLKALIRAVPHFDMKPGERLVSLRDASVQPNGDTAGTGIRDLAGLAGRVEPEVPEPTIETGAPLLRLEALSKAFSISKGSWISGTSQSVKAVDRVSLDIRKGECLGLVGESGCGKTTLSKMIMRAISPTSGRMLFATPQGDVDIAKLDNMELRRFRRRIQMVFQDPVNSLSPRMTVLNILCEPLEIARVGTAEQQRQRAVQLMRTVGLDPRFLSRYPHSFSGGQRQRIGIARALALAPDLMICDEPVSALDVSVQAQILNLLNDLRRELGLTYLFISHNLAVVDYVADRIAVMARGRIVEIARREQLFANATHPYTKRLLSAVPYPDLDRPLDFATIGASEASDPRSWPRVFQPDPTDETLLGLVEMAPGHHVLARPDFARAATVPT